MCLALRHDPISKKETSADRDTMQNIALVIGIERIISRLHVRYEVDRYQRISILRVERHTQRVQSRVKREFNVYICSCELN